MLETMVSIICNTYNHERYIARALDGFVNQITSFKYEILIHDDASTDNTPDIIRAYCCMYPDLIKPIFQKYNQYSKGIAINNEYQFNRAQGKYLAICEGDDFWTDRYKLQKQFDVLEKYNNIDMCAHAARQIDAQTGKLISIIRPASTSRVLTLKEVIKGGGSYLPTASLFFRKNVAMHPPRFRKAYALDYTLQVSGAIKGGVYYIDDLMSSYRFLSPESFTLSLKKNYNKKLKHKIKMRKVLFLMNCETKYKYNSIFIKLILENYIKSFVLFILALTEHSDNI